VKEESIISFWERYRKRRMIFNFTSDVKFKQIIVQISDSAMHYIEAELSISLRGYTPNQVLALLGGSLDQYIWPFLAVLRNFVVGESHPELSRLASEMLWSGRYFNHVDMEAALRMVPWTEFYQNGFVLGSVRLDELVAAFTTPVIWVGLKRRV